MLFSKLFKRASKFTICIKLDNADVYNHTFETTSIGQTLGILEAAVKQVKNKLKK